MSILEFDVRVALLPSIPQLLTCPLDNHKPELSSTSSISPLQLKPSSGSDPTTYDLSFKENSEKYRYNGTRTSGDGQFILIFDPEKKHFVLHRLDSEFDMNLVSTPWDQDESNLRSQYPQLEAPAKTQPTPPTPAPQPVQRKATKVSGPPKTTTKRQKVEKPKKAKAVREPSPEEEEESDDGLTVEYPGGPPPQKQHYISTPVFQRAVSEDASEEDADGEPDEWDGEGNQDVDHLTLPSPAGNNNVGAMSDEDIELDLEAELEQALKETAGTGADESSESEEE